MPEANPYSTNGAASKRGRLKPPPPPITISPGQVSFRILCHVSKTGGVIGKSGSIVKLLQQQTGAKIRVEEAVSGCEERIIRIIGTEIVTKQITLRGLDEEDEDGGQVSPAQEALVRVFERVLEVDGETEGVFPPPSNGGVSCRLLAATSQIGSVIGKGGKIIEKIKKESGAKIRVLSAENLPACASPTDELIQIMGDILAVKKALVAVSRRLQDCPPVDKAQMSVRTLVETVPRGTFSDPHAEFLPHQSSLLPPTPGSSVDYASRGRPRSTEVDRISTLPKKAQQEVAFRMLCSTDKVGGVIGKGGIIIRALQNDTGASISVGASVADSDERVITVLALETPESRYSPARNAVVLVFTRSVEAGIEKGLESGTAKGAPVSARLLVPSNQVGCLLGKGGTIISEIRKVTGAGIRILRGDQVPKCASENDEVVQIIGEFGNVRDALFHITGRLRDNLFPSKILNGAEPGSYSSSAMPEISPYRRARESTPPGLHPLVGLSHNFGQHSTLTQGVDHRGLSHGLDRPPSPRLWTSKTVGGESLRGITDFGRGSTTLRGGLELGSGNKSAIVTNTTVEIAVSEHVIGSVYGERGSNLTRLRQISGANVTVQDPHHGQREVRIIVSGTPDQTQAAQSLIQAFILTGHSSPDHRSRLL
ncbi:hypothetical protein HHK36_003898 [Tetracentron sinense]|uniref:K Homology domain-containing protein n=1 Tax=Tetracentron sinense TaxID=13715 RepID=A0A834ZYT0_TETSI|nr:hypothetical protein HHK36_003898 [Tetracentron sinense]